MVDFCERADNYHSKLQAERCLKRHASNCVPRFESSGKRRQLYSSSSMLTSVPSKRENLSSQVEDCAADEDYMHILSLFEGENGSNCTDAPTDEYKLFLDHLREDGSSYVLEMMDLRSGMPMFVKYELDDLSSDGTAEITSQSSSNIHCKGEGPSVGVRGKKPYKSRFAHHEQNRDLRVKSELVSISSSLDHEHKNGVPPQDDSYQVFINHIRLHGDSIILELNGFSVKYEEEEENLSAPEGSSSENVSLEDEPGLNSYSTSFQPSDSVSGDNGGHRESWSDGRPSYFKTELMKALNKPYKQWEHKDLWQKATECKALHSLRCLRTTDKSYPTKRDSMSYLDFYPDLAAQIKSADKYGALTLLRGFFFWLKHLCHEGAFMPWTKTPSCDRGTLPCHDSNEMTPIQIS